MTNAPESRQTHVVRLVGTNSDGDVLQDIWVDVERIDRISIRTQTSLPQFNIENQYQEVQINLKWRDDPTADGYITEDNLSGDADTGRVHELIKVCDPQANDDLKNPDQWVAVKTIKHIDMDQQGVGTSQKRFVAESLDADREVNPRRIYHYDTNIDGNARAAFDSDKTLKAFVQGGQYYQRDDSTRDKDQYIEHEVIEHLEKHINDEAYSPGGTSQGVQLRLNNQYLIDESVPAKLDKKGPDDRNPPYRLDPFQNIINVNWSKVGAVFVMGDSFGQIWRCEMQNKTSKPDFKKMSARFGDPTDNGGNITCGSYTLIKTTGAGATQTPTFVLAGIDYQYDHIDEGTGEPVGQYVTAMIQLSNDGTSWTTVYFNDQGLLNQTTPNRMIWDEKDQRFYLDVYRVVGPGPYTETRELWASNTGHDWSIAGSVAGSDSNDLFDAHCKYKWIGGGSLAGTGFSNDQFGLDKAQTDLTKTYAFGGIVDENGKPAKDPKDAVGLLITTEDLGKAGSSSSYPPVSFAAALWGRAGYLDVAVFEISSDDGDSWQKAGTVTADDEPGLAIGSLAAAPRRDIKK